MDCLKVVLNNGEVLEPRKVIRTKIVNEQFYNLVKWRLNSASGSLSEDVASTSTALTRNEDKTNKSICSWITDEELQLCCSFLSHKVIQNDSKKDTNDESTVTASEYLEDMKSDVSSLVKRARKQMEAATSKLKPSINLSHTLQILTTYAGFELASGVFKNSGALDLILDLMFTNNLNTRRAAGKILKALAAHDAGSRAYVLLSLTKEEQEPRLTNKTDHLVDYEHRSMVMEMFSETASSEEAQVVALDSVQLPHVSSKVLFSLMKKYLRLTSLLDQEKSQAGNQFNWMFLAGREKSLCPNVHQFNVAMVMSDLILTLSQIMGWKLEPIVDKEKLSRVPGTTLSEPVHHKAMFPKKFRNSSIDKKLLATLLKPKKTTEKELSELQPVRHNKPDSSLFNIRPCSSFDTKREYANYFRAEATVDCWVKLVLAYPGLSCFEEGRFKQVNESSQYLVQVYWPRLDKLTWVDLGNLVIMDSTAVQSKLGFSLINPETSLLWPFLSGMNCNVEKFYEIEHGETNMSDVISQSEWWNILFVASYMKKEIKNEIVEVIKKQHSDEIHLSCFVPNRATLLKVLSLVVQRNIDTEKKFVNIGQLIKSERNVESEAQGGKPSTSKENLREKHEPGKQTDEKPALFDGNEKTNDTVIMEVDDIIMRDDILVESDDVIKRKAKAQDMGMRINLIIDDETSRKYTKILMKEENFKLAKTMVTSFIHNKSAPIFMSSWLEVIAGCDDKVLIVLTYMAYVISSGKAHSLRTEKTELKLEYASTLANIFVNNSIHRSVDVTIAYLNLVLACLSDPAQEPANRDADNLEFTFANQGHIKIILKIISSHLGELNSKTSKKDQETEIIFRKCILCLSKILMATKFAESTSPNSYDFSLLATIFCSILTKNVPGPGSEEGTGEDLTTSLVSSIHYLVQNVKQSTWDEIYYEISCLVCLILRQDKSKTFLDGNEEMLKEINSMLVAVVSGKTRKMVLRWQGLMVSMKRVDFLDDSDDDELIIGTFDISDVTKSKSVEKLSKLAEDLSSSDEDNGVKMNKIIEGILPTLKFDEVSELQLRGLEILADFLENNMDSNLVFEEKVWSENLLYLNQVLKKCSTELSSTFTNLSIGIANVIIHIFEVLVDIDEDFAVGLCVHGAKQNIIKVEDKHGTMALSENSEILKKIISAHEHQQVLNYRLLAIILGSSISSSFECVDEARREDKQINIPLFRNLLSNLCKGSEVDSTENKCWEKIEVSSNPRQSFKLTDGNPKTYWESNGSSGAHWIDVTMKKGVIVRKMSIVVAQEDSSYMPARIVVFGGTTAADATTQLCSVTVGSLDNEIVVLENEKKFWPLVRISIRRCQQGGIDTRIHGLKISGPKPSLWPIFHNQLYTRTCLYYNVQCCSWLGEGFSMDRVLEVPVRLKRALKHEQEFADSFLPTDESALVLGQAYHSVLSGKLLKVLFKEQSCEGNESSINEEPKTLFDNLIGRYLHQYHDQTNSNASKFRQLMKLLLDLDSSSSGKDTIEETKTSENVENVRNWTKKVQPGPGFKTTSDKGSEADNLSSECRKNSTKHGSDEVYSYIERIMKSWNFLVGKNFSEFLNKILDGYEGFGQDVKTVFNKIYNKSKQLEKCTKDLFSNSSRFTMVCPIAMWRSVILGSVKNSVKMSYIFSILIHNHLSGTSHDYQVFERVKEVLSLCAGAFPAFERIYCLFLSRRLLDNSTVSLKLETEACSSIQLCFPKRNPVNMLRDVRTSSEMMQRYVRNSLENCDSLVASGHESFDENWKNYEFLSSGSLNFYVLWPGWYLPSHFQLEPIEKVLRKVSPSLQSQLSSFESFCRAERIENSNCTFEKGNPALNWSWLGFAELHDLKNQVDLQVSTIQMVILLHFNLEEKVDAMSYLECKSGKSAVENLVEKKIVFINDNILTLNDDLENDVNCVSDDVTSFQQVDDVISHASAVRAAVLDCAIVRIVKRERSISFDLLIEYVMKYCCQSSSSKYSDDQTREKFLPAVNDVRSKVEQLVDLEYLMWSNGKRTIHYNFQVDSEMTDLENLQDKSEDFKEKRSNFRKENLRSENGNYLDRTPKCLLEKPVLRFTEIDYCKNQFTREDILHEILSLINFICQTTYLNISLSESLLLEFEWNCDKLLSSYFENKNATLEMIGFSAADSNILSECPICLAETDEELMYEWYCGHNCCEECLKSYLQTQLALGTSAHTSCFIPNCRSRITTIIYQELHNEGTPKYTASLVRSYVELNKEISWCHNPKGCEKIVCKAKQGKCMACGWQTCFSCSYVEAHNPATCGHLSQWIDDGGYYNSMDEDAQSHHLARLIAKRCPNCHANIEKNHGCLHMKCAKCRHDFCWRCLQPWKPTHKDYYHCSLKVSKFANAGIRFVEFNKRCQHHCMAKQYAIDIHKRLTTFCDPSTNPVNLKFAYDLCTTLIDCRKVLAYSSIFSYYTYLDKTASISLHCSTLENKILELQNFVSEVLLQSADIKFNVSQINDGVMLRGSHIVKKCENLINSIIIFAEQNPQGAVELEDDENNLEKCRPAGASDTEQTETDDWSTMDEEESSQEGEDGDSNLEDYYDDDADLLEAGQLFFNEDVGSSDNSEEIDDYSHGWM